MLAERLARLKRYDAAIAVMKVNIEVNPNLLSSYSLLADLYERTGNMAAAVDAMQTALALDPGSDYLKRRLADLTRRKE